MSSPGTLRFGQVASTPSPPPVNYDLIYVKTDDVLYIQDSSGVEVALGSASSITSLTGDVSATGPGSAVATVNFVGGATAAHIASATAAYLAATSIDTPSTLVLRDSSGNSAFNLVSVNALDLLGSVSGTLTLAAPSTFSNYTLALPTTIGSTGQVLTTDGVGTTSWSSVITSSLTNGKILVGNISNVATPQTPNGDIGMTDAAVFTVTKIQGSAVITTPPTDAQFLVWNNGSSQYVPVIMSGDVSMTNAGVTSITSTAVTGKLLTGYATGTNTPILATNSILTAFENLQAQVSATVGAAITSLTGDISATGPGASAATVVAIQGHSVSTTTPTDAQILIYNIGTSKWTPESISGDATLSDTGTITLATVNSNTGTFGSSTAIPSFTVNGKGLITAVTTDPVVAPAGTLTGTTLASNVVNSSLTSLGTISSGTWNGTTIAIVNGGTGQTTAPTAFNALSPMTTLGDIIYGGTSGAGTRLAGNTTATREFLASQGTGSFANTPTWGALVSGDIPNNAANTTGTASNIIATSNSTLTTLSALSLPTTQLSGTISLTTQVSGILPIVNGGTNNNTAYTSGSIIFSNGASLTQDNANFYWNDTNYCLGIGTIPSSAVMIDGVNISAASKLVQMTGYGVGSTTGYRGRFARGTIGTPSAVQSGDVLNVISGRGYGASQFAAASTGVINFVAGETFTNTSNMTYLQFEATPTGSVTAVEHMRVAATGVTLGPQSSSTDLHTVTGGWIRTTKTITSSYTVDTTTTDDIILCNQSAGITITLPTATVGRTIVIKDISGNAQTNPITVTPASGGTNIEGLNANKAFYTNFGSWTLSVGSAGNWWVVG